MRASQSLLQARAPTQDRDRGVGDLRLAQRELLELGQLADHRGDRVTHLGVGEHERVEAGQGGQHVGRAVVEMTSCAKKDSELNSMIPTNGRRKSLIRLSASAF